MNGSYIEIQAGFRLLPAQLLLRRLKGKLTSVYGAKMLQFHSSGSEKDPSRKDVPASSSAIKSGVLPGISSWVSPASVTPVSGQYMCPSIPRTPQVLLQWMFLENCLGHCYEKRVKC